MGPRILLASHRIVSYRLAWHYKFNEITLNLSIHRDTFVITNFGWRRPHEFRESTKQRGNEHRQKSNEKLNGREF